MGVRHVPFKYNQANCSATSADPARWHLCGPHRIKDVAGVRTQFHHIIDIVPPTILEAAAIKAPQWSMESAEAPRGVSMVL